MSSLSIHTQHKAKRGDHKYVVRDGLQQNGRKMLNVVHYVRNALEVVKAGHNIAI